jgi:hypothetical protein
MLIKVHKSIYTTDPLRQAVKELFGGKTGLYAPRRALSSSATKVGVTAVRDGLTTNCIIGNYNHQAGFDPKTCDIERTEDESRGFGMVEAALATSAAPGYLESFIKAETGVDYSDGAMYANCPAKLAFDQMKKIWSKDDSAAMLDILVSVGTGNQAGKKPSRGSLLRTFDADFVKAIRRLVENHTASEGMWGVFTEDIQALAPELSPRLHRLNPWLDDGKRVELYDWKKLEGIKKESERWVAENAPLLKVVANKLIAGLFFFEPTAGFTTEDDGRTRVDGKILCRLNHNDAEMDTLLGKRVRSFWYTEHHLNDARRGPELGHIPADNWKSMLPLGRSPGQMRSLNERQNTSKFEIPHTIVVERRGPRHIVLAVKVSGSDEYYPLSGFPASFDELEARSKMTWL